MNDEKLKQLRAEIADLKRELMRFEDKLDAPGGESKEKLLSEMQSLKLRLFDIEQSMSRIDNPVRRMVLFRKSRSTRTRESPRKESGRLSSYFR